MAMPRSGTRLTEQPTAAGDIAPVPLIHTDEFARNMAYGQAAADTTSSDDTAEHVPEYRPVTPNANDNTPPATKALPLQPTETVESKPVLMSLDDAIEPDEEGTGRETPGTLIVGEQPHAAQDLATQPGQTNATHGGNADKADEIIEDTTAIDPVNEKAAWTVEDHIKQFMAQGGDLRHLVLAADETYADCRMLTENLNQTEASLEDVASGQNARVNTGISYIAYQLRRVDADGMQDLVSKANSIRLEEEKSGKTRALQPAHTTSQDMDVNWHTPSSPALAA